jgi:hypothetical protein
MKKSSKIIIALIAVLVLLGAGFYVLHGKKSSSSKNSKTETSTKDVISQTPADSFTEQAIADDSAVALPTDSVEAKASAQSDNYLDVSKDDCTNLCQNFTDPGDLTYCQQVCTISPVEKSIKSLSNCDKFKKLEKDYCLKDLAVNMKNIKTCDTISDSNIKKVCQNILNSQN